MLHGIAQRYFQHSTILVARRATYGTCKVWIPKEGIFIDALADQWLVTTFLATYVDGFGEYTRNICQLRICEDGTITCVDAEALLWTDQLGVRDEIISIVSKSLSEACEYYRHRPLLFKDVANDNEETPS